MSERLSAIRPYHRIYVAGHNGMVGSALARALRARGYANLVTRALGWRHRYELEEGVRLTYRWCMESGVFERAAAA